MILGIDPGASGGFAFISPDATTVQAFSYKEEDEAALVAIIKTVKITKAYLELVGAMPKQGVSSTFKFGKNYGWWQGVLVTAGIPFERVTPLKWQTKLGCRTKGDKNVSKRRAQELFPSIKVTHALADALLIAEYGRRTSYLEVL